MLVELAATGAEPIGVEATASDLPPGTSSDHESFKEAGVRALLLSSDDLTNIHTPKDSIAAIDNLIVEQLGDLDYRSIIQLLDRIAPS